MFNPTKKIRSMISEAYLEIKDKKGTEAANEFSKKVNEIIFKTHEPMDKKSAHGWHMGHGALHKAGPIPALIGGLIGGGLSYLMEIDKAKDIIKIYKFSSLKEA